MITVVGRLRMGKKLISKKEIIQYLELSWRSILKEGFPVTKIGGRIMSHTDMLDEHIKQRIEKDRQVHKHDI